MSSREAARSVSRGELDLIVCEDCGFVANRAFDLSRLSYGEDYDNTQSHSAYFDAYLDGLVSDLVEKQGVSNATIVEVGCGKGQFLRKLVSYPGGNNRGFGFDPSYVGPDEDLDGRLQFRRCYYDQSCTDVAADVVVCRHVIEHVPEPVLLLRSVRAALAQAPEARVFFETPCVDWILRNRVVWDFFYEHCSLFTASSLAFAFERAGFEIESVSHIFGGQYLWLGAKVAEKAKIHADVSKAAAVTVDLARNYAANERDLRSRWAAELQRLKQSGRVALWGAGAKGATFANLIDADGAMIDCVVDLNPKKQNGFIPGTGHDICAPGDLPRRGIATAILMNPNYRGENLALLAREGIPLELAELGDL
jgi:SAM-dependent methyltransferase